MKEHAVWDTINEIAKQYEDFYDCNLHIEGFVPDILDPKKIWNHLAFSVAGELMNNCVENRLPDMEKGASNVWATFYKDRVEVRDDFVYTHPEQVLELINGILESGRPHTTSKTRVGGMGLYIVPKELKKVGGFLEYKIENGTIVAIAHWGNAELTYIE